TSIVKCGSCGSGMTTSGSSDGRLRVCCSRHRESKSCTHTRSYFLDAVEIGVVNILRELLSHPDDLRTFIDTYVAERRLLITHMAKVRSRAEAEPAKARAAFERLYLQLINGVVEQDFVLKHKP